jgi:hypothetical protein
MQCFIKNVGSVTTPMRHLFQIDNVKVQNCPFFGQPWSGRQNVIFVMSHESE